MRKLIRISILGIALSILLQSCVKNKTSKHEPTYVLKGQLVAIEDGLPILDYDLVLITHAGYMGSEKREIGNAVTDENGDFIFNVSTKYYLNLAFADDIVPTFRTPFRPIAGDTIDIGIIKDYRP